MKKDSMIGLVLILTIICAVTAALLGYVNDVTKGPIEISKQQKTEAAMKDVIDADAFELLTYTGADTQITSVYKAGDAGYVVLLTVTGSQGPIGMVVGVDNDSTVTGVSIVSQSETPGLGDKAGDDSFKSQYVGTTGDLAVNKDGGTIVALTGATITSRAVTKGVNAAVVAAATMG